MKTKEGIVNHGLGYGARLAIPSLGIEHESEHMKDFLWEYVLKLVEESNKLNIRWSHMDIYMQVHQKREDGWDHPEKHNGSEE